MMTHFRFVVLLNGTSLLLSMPLHAQETGPDVVVLGQGLALPPGTPAYGSVTLEKTRLAEDASGTIEHALGDIAGFHRELSEKDYRFAKPGLEVKPWETREISVIDPFGNRLHFHEVIEKAN